MADVQNSDARNSGGLESGPAASSVDASAFDAIDPALKVAGAELEISASSTEVFELIADPRRRPESDGNDNLASAADAQRVRSIGESFVTILTKGVDRENRVAEFDERRLIAWKPSEVGGRPLGQVWRWEVELLGEGSCLVCQTHDWAELRDPNPLPRAQSTTAGTLLASMNRLKELAEG